MAEIPEELIIEILLQPPVVSLLRLRCVSKRWRNLIDSPDFAKSHLNLSNKAYSVIIFYEKPCAYYVDFDSVCNGKPCCNDFDSVCNEKRCCNSPPVLKKVKEPWHGKKVREFFGGVCNGLLCIYRADCGIVLWNPSTRKHVEVALPLHLLDEVRGFCSWGFSYDSDSDDYKVVTVAYPKYGSSRSSVVWVYSLMRGLWKSIGDFPNVSLFPGQHGVFVNGELTKLRSFEMRYKLDGDYWDRGSKLCFSS